MKKKRGRTTPTGQRGLKVVLGGLACLFLWLLPAASCAPEPPAQDPLLTVLASDDPAIARVMASPDKYEVQIRYTRIFREGDSVRFANHDYRVEPDHYFYPASMVKFPIAVLALEKLNSLDSIDRHTRYYVEGDSLENTFERDILEIFAVSDNHANNRLFEFLGQDAINDGLASKQVGPARISHRLGVHRDEVSTRPLILYRNDSMTVQSLPIVSRPVVPLELEGIRKGTGYGDGDSIVSAPFDFSLKNYLPVPSLDGILKRVIFPEKFPPSQRFNLSPEQRAFLLEAMQITPREAGYDPEIYPDGYCKFFLFGDTEAEIPEALQIFNKVGFAYGTLTDCAYIRDARNGVEFMLTATILVNGNGIFNDNQYEYDEVGIPFLAALGRAVYDYEASRQP
jgi:hypothetical protein